MAVVVLMKVAAREWKSLADPGCHPAPAWAT